VTYLAVDAARRASGQDWRWVPFGRLARLRRERNVRSDAVLLALSAETGMRARPDDGGRQLPAEGTIADYWLVEPGDIVFNPMWAMYGGVAESTLRGAVSPAYRVYEPGPFLVARFAHYFLRSRPALEQYRLVVRGLTTFDRSVTREDAEGMPVPVPPVNVQRAIADYLDIENSRIDAVIRKTRRRIALLEERFSAYLAGQVERAFAAYGSVRVRHLIESIEQGWSPECDATEAAPDEWGVLKTSAVSSGTFHAEENKRLPRDAVPVERWMVRNGDLLAVRGSGSLSHVGQTTVAETRGRKLLLSDLIYRLRLKEGQDAGLLAAMMKSSIIRAALESRVRTDAGQTLKVRADDLKDLKVPAIPQSQQGPLVADIREARSRVEGLASRLRTQVTLMIERRQALISAAVTGEVLVFGVGT
jgi:type I restriction enzyme S subunit